MSQMRHCLMWPFKAKRDQACGEEISRMPGAAHHLGGHCWCLTRSWRWLEQSWLCPTHWPCVLHSSVRLPNSWLCPAWPWLAAAALTALVVLAAQTASASDRLEFTRLIAHWDGYGSPEYLSFVAEIQPEIAQVGFYGAHFWSLAHTPYYDGYPAHFPVRGLAECGQWFENLNARLHAQGVRVVGHFNLKFLVGDADGPEGPRGFFHFYRQLWDERELGPRPVADPQELLERDAQGRPLVDRQYSIGGMAEYWGCLNNPHWRTVLRAWVRRGIQRGVDGYMINYFYRHNCLCEHCQSAFRAYLAERFSPQELQAQLGINDLATHQFDELVAWHDPAESTPLRREMLRFSQIANKRAFDEVFVEYGRSLKPDLILAQWNHLGDFSQIAGDERCLLPAELWGRDEDYLWYSTGGALTFTDLARGFLGEATLQARYIRGAFDDKPFTLGKYEQTRIRVAIAELAANGGAPMGFYTRFQNPATRAELVRYYGFLRRHNHLYHANQSHAEAILLFPRRAIHTGDLRPLANFKALGQDLLDRKVLFDVRPDDLADPQVLCRYRLVVDPAAAHTVPEQALAGLSRFEGPPTVRISASRPPHGGEIDLHLVNYNRQEPPEPRSSGNGIVDERPIAVPGMAVDLLLPANAHATEVVFLTPEEPEPSAIPFFSNDGRLHCMVPEFLVYAVLRVKLTAAGPP